MGPVLPPRPVSAQDSSFPYLECIPSCLRADLITILLTEVRATVAKKLQGVEIVA